MSALLVALLSSSLSACGGDDKGDDGDNADDTMSAADDDGGEAPADGGDNADGADGGAVDNVAACQEFVDAWNCDGVDLAQVVMCNVYEGYTCDVSAYFECLADETTCDAASLQAAVSSCASLASCG